MPSQQHEADRNSFSSREEVETVDQIGTDSLLERIRRNLAASDEEYRRNPPRRRVSTEV